MRPFVIAAILGGWWSCGAVAMVGVLLIVAAARMRAERVAT